MGFKSYIKYPPKILLKLDKIGIIRLSDEKYLKIMYKSIFDKDLNLENPKTYNEKLQWLKLYDRKDIYTTMVDKYDVKEYVAKIIGNEYIIPTLGVYDKFDDIDFNKLPNKFVIKCTHDSGGIFIVDDKSKIDIKSIKKKIEKTFNKNFYYFSREWPYKNVKPRIIVEEYMHDDVDNELRDYKFFCFDGKVKMLFVATNRQGAGDTCFDFFDKEYNHLDIINGHPNAKTIPHKPKMYDKMIELAEKLSKGIPHVRVDFYEVNGKIYFGEMTFYHWSGFVKFEPEEWDKNMGDMINIGDVKNEDSNSR